MFFFFFINLMTILIRETRFFLCTHRFVICVGIYVLIRILCREFVRSIFYFRDICLRVRERVTKQESYHC